MNASFKPATGVIPIQHPNHELCHRTSNPATGVIPDTTNNFQAQIPA
jgi:hypothetical protein